MLLHSFDKQQPSHQWSHLSTADAPRRRIQSRTPVLCAHTDNGTPPVASWRSGVQRLVCMPLGMVFRTCSSNISFAKIRFYSGTAKCFHNYFVSVSQRTHKALKSPWLLFYCFLNSTLAKLSRPGCHPTDSLSDRR